MQQKVELWHYNCFLPLCVGCLRSVNLPTFMGSHQKCPVNLYVTDICQKMLYNCLLELLRQDGWLMETTNCHMDCAHLIAVCSAAYFVHMVKRPPSVKLWPGPYFLETECDSFIPRQCEPHLLGQTCNLLVIYYARFHIQNNNVGKLVSSSGHSRLGGQHSFISRQDKCVYTPLYFNIAWNGN